MRSLHIAIGSFLLALVVACASSGEARAGDTINAVLGDLSWRATRCGPPGRADEVTRIRAHLQFVLNELRTRDVTSLPIAAQQARASLLESLARYADRGVFPRRVDDAFSGRRPRFIDDRGVHCAAGQLIADSGEPELARAINQRNEYAYVLDIHEPALTEWAATHGFTVEELARIQPQYRWRHRPPPSPERVRESILDSVDSIVMACAPQHAPPSRLAIHVARDRQGRTTITTRESDAFAQCFVERANSAVPGGGSYEGPAQSFRFDLDLALTSPQKQLEQHLATWTPGSGCHPRPGPIPQEVTLEVASSKDGLVTRAKTAPSNSEIEQCLERSAAEQFRGFGAGNLELRATRTLPLTSSLAGIAERVRTFAAHNATQCPQTSIKGATARISVKAQPDEEQFTVFVDDYEPFATCMREKLQQQLRDQYSVTRPGPGGLPERYFRIDATVNTTVTIPLKPKAAR